MPLVEPVLAGPGIPPGGGVRGPRGERGDRPDGYATCDLPLARHATCRWCDMRLAVGATCDLKEGAAAQG